MAPAAWQGSCRIAGFIRQAIRNRLVRGGRAIVKAKALALIGASLLLMTLSAETLGYFEQKFTSLNFERGKWSRTVQQPCYTYTATEDGAMVDVLRFGTSNLVPFKAAKGLNVVVCGSTAAFDEGFEARKPPLN
jgi:hypothetical protein